MEKGNNPALLSEKTTHSILIAISKTIKNIKALEFLTEALRSRFKIEISLVFEEPDLLFFNNGMLNFLGKGSVDRVLITDRPALFYFDLIEFAKRHDTDFISIIDAQNLVENGLDFIKKLVEHVANQASIITNSAQTSVTFQKKTLRELSSFADESFSSMLTRLSYHEKVETEQNQVADFSNRASLFVTKEGISRFGGETNFLKSKFVIDGLSPDKFRRVWCINNELTIADYQIKLNTQSLSKSRFVEIPGIISANGNLLVDINPAAVHQPTSQDIIDLNVPRCVLSLTKFNTSLDSLAVSKKAIFAMSNHNKASYLAGAVYSIAMQTYPITCLEIVDDVSSDSSKQVFEKIISEFDQKNFPISISYNSKNRGTYWIRNSIIHKYVENNNVYFVNDSDDFSTAQRACIQLATLLDNPSFAITFGDIIRVDNTHKILPLDGKVERYGTASLASETITHSKYGYYENIMKNADTEFIERLKHYSGKKVVNWFRYPVLFQPFDGSNLTSDIYSIASNTGLVQNLNIREKHRALFMNRFKSLSIDDLVKYYSFPEYVTPEVYHSELEGFVIG